MQTYDLTLKDLIMGGAPALFRQIAGTPELRLAPLEVPVIGGGRLDLFGELDGETAIHAELQAENDGAMAIRMLGYLWMGLRQRSDLKLRQMVLYVGRDPMRMPDALDGPGLRFRFDLIDARLLDPAVMLASDHPCDIVMALFAASDDIGGRVRAVIRRLAARFADDPARLRDALAKLALLAPLRYAQPVVLEEFNLMPYTINLETDPFASRFFLKGRAEGRAEGRTEGLNEARTELFLRLLKRRFGVVAPGIETRIRTTPGEVVDEWLDRAITANTLAEIFGSDLPTG